MAGLDFLPDAEGYVFDLPDGVPSRLQCRVSAGRPVPEIRVANRDAPLPPRQSVQQAAERIF
eukprot:954790-Alexandrium_andersonii.AAC.1